MVLHNRFSQTSGNFLCIFFWFWTTLSPAQGPKTVSANSVNTTPSIFDLAPAMIWRCDTNHNLQIQCFSRRTVFRQPPSRTFYCNLVFVKHSGEERDSYRWDGRNSICTEKGFDKPTMFWIQREIVKENPCFVNHFLSFTFLSHTCNEIFF